jgi:hypothetical protein
MRDPVIIAVTIFLILIIAARLFHFLPFRPNPVFAGLVRLHSAACLP